MQRVAPETALPGNVEVRNRGAEIEITRRWFGSRYYFLIAFSVVWFGALAALFLAPLNGADADPLFMIFPAVHVGIGLGIVYAILAGLFNETRITAGAERLSLRHGPVPWPGSRELPASGIRQLYSKEKVHSSLEWGTRVRYQIHAVDHDGRTFPLLGRLETIDQALFLEQAIESRLGIESAPLRDEIPRSA